MSDNTLGLQLNPEEPAGPEETAAPEPEAPQSPNEEGKQKEGRGRGYVNPDRVKTGGSQREKLGEDELAERMARIRLQNEKIKQRRLDVEADKAAFQKTQDEDRAKQARNRQVQADINKKRDEVAKRKMEKMQNREWDSGKPAPARSRNWAQEVEKEKGAPQKEGAKEKPVKATDESQAAPSGWDTKGEYTDADIPPEPEHTPLTIDEGWAAPTESPDTSGQWTRGGSPSAFRSRGGGRGRGGRGRGRGKPQTQVGQAL